MAPDKFDMVDMGGIDLIMMQGEEVPGLYNRLVESITQCRYQCLYNWLFDGVIIPPTYVELEVNEDDEVAINEGIIVTQDDVIHIYSIEPPAPPPVEPTIVSLSADENRTYTVPEGVDGFNPVTVSVPAPEPVIVSLSADENRTYTVPEGVDGFNPVTVSVPSAPTNYSLQVPIHFDLIGGYIDGNKWYVGDTAARTDIYQVFANKYYILHLGGVVGNRFRSVFFTTDPAQATSTLTGVDIVLINDPHTYSIGVTSNKLYMFSPPSDGYIGIGKTNQSVNGLKSYLVEFIESI